MAYHIWIYMCCFFSLPFGSLKSCVNVIHKPYPYSSKFNAVDTDYNDNKRRRANVPHMKTNMGLARRYIYDEKKDTRQDLDASGMERCERGGGGGRLAELATFYSFYTIPPLYLRLCHLTSSNLIWLNDTHEILINLHFTFRYIHAQFIVFPPVKNGDACRNCRRVECCSWVAAGDKPGWVGG